MNIIIDREALENVITKMNITYEIVDIINESGISCKHNAVKQFYIEFVDNDINNELLIVSISDEHIWELDKFLSPMDFKKEKVNLQKFNINQDVYAYVKRHEIEHSNSVTLDDIIRNQNANLQLKQCDIYLMIPGKMKKGSKGWENIMPPQCDIFEHFKDCINKTVEDEYNSNFAKDLDRKCLAQVILKINDLTDHKVYKQKAIIGMVKHKTGLCIMEIMVQNCNIGGNKLLNYYCGNELIIVYEGHEYKIDEFCDINNMRLYGRKRSIAFVYNDISNEEITNALANEEFPMGKISGQFAVDTEIKNIAQYDTAEVYVSSVTMLEKCKMINNFIEDRFRYQTLEIFFVELLLLQDASMDKVYKDLLNVEDVQYGYVNVNEAIAKCEQLNFDMAYTIRFANYEQFVYPTTRQSAKNVANNFGIELIFDKYTTNKELLEAMIDTNKRKQNDKQENLKNKFLFLISALATIGSIADIIFTIYEQKEVALNIYFYAAVIVIVVYCIYKIGTVLLNSVYKFLKESEKLNE